MSWRIQLGNAIVERIDIHAQRGIKIDALVRERAESRVEHTHYFSRLVINDGLALSVPQDRNGRPPADLRIGACTKLMQIGRAADLVRLVVN